MTDSRAQRLIDEFNEGAALAAEGDVGDRVAWLRRFAAVDWIADETADKLYAIADILSQRHPAPVPVSERLPGDQLCWWYEPDEDDGYGGRWTLLRIRGGTGTYSHWLPAHALPLPQGEEVAE